MEKKTKKGRPSKEPTFTKSIRIDSKTKNFLATLDNQCKFINDIIHNTPEFQAFLTKEYYKSKDRALFN